MHDIQSIRQLPCKRRPKPYENLLGFILRHTELMGWEKITWLIDYAKIYQTKRHNTSFKFIFDSQIDLTFLSHITCNDHQEINNLAYPEVSKKNLQVLFFKQQIPKIAINYTKPRLCPQCLITDNYTRAIWDFGLVTCCPIHQCLLIDTCPECGKRLSWFRGHVSCCGNDKCNYDFRDYPKSKVSFKETRLAEHIHYLLKLSHNEPPFQKTNPIRKLSLNSLFEFVIQMTHNFILDRKIHNKTYHFQARTVEERHKILKQVFPILFKWPKQFYLQLDKISAKETESEKKFGLHAQFGTPFINSFIRFFSHPEFDFVQNAFEQYLYQNGIDFPPRKVRWIQTEKFKTNNIGIEKASLILNAKINFVEQMIRIGKLEASVYKANGLRHFNIRKTSIEKLMAERENWINLKDAAKFFGLSERFVHTMIAENYISPICDPTFDQYGRYLFELDELKRFMSRIYQTHFLHRGKLPSGALMCFKKALYYLKTKRYDWASFVQAIIDGELIPFAIGSGAGLNVLLFSKKQIKSTNDLREAQFDPDQLTVVQVATRLNITKSNVWGLIKAGLLRAQFAPGHKRLQLIPLNSALRFQEKYCIGPHLLDRFQVPSRRLYYRLRQIGIIPVSGRTVDGCELQIYHRADIEGLDPNQLIN